MTKGRSTYTCVNDPFFNYNYESTLIVSATHEYIMYKGLVALIDSIVDPTTVNMDITLFNIRIHIRPNTINSS